MNTHLSTTLALSAALIGCQQGSDGSDGVCKDAQPGDACIAAFISSLPPETTKLRVELGGASVVRHQDYPLPSKEDGVPAALAIVFDGSGHITINVTALANESPVAYGYGETGIEAGTHRRVDISLGDTPPDLSRPSPPDLGGTQQPDMTDPQMVVDMGSSPDKASSCTTTAAPATCRINGGQFLNCTFDAVMDNPMGNPPPQCLARCIDDPVTGHVTFRFLPPSIAEVAGNFSGMDEYGDPFVCTRP